MGAAVASLVLIGCGGGGGTSEESDTSAVVPKPAAMQGSWRLFVTTEGQQADTGAIIPGANVPTAETVSQMDVADFSRVLAPVSVAGYTVSVTGNTIGITGPGTNYTVTVNSLSTSHYQFCSACGVGAQVSLQLDATLTGGGTFDGSFEPATTMSVSAVVKWVRVG